MSSENIIRFYERGGEQNRLESELFRLEGICTKEIISK